MSGSQSSSWAQGAPPRSRKGLVATAIILGVLLIAVVVVAALALRGLLPFGAAASASATDQTLTLEPANSLGQDPFAGTSLAATVSAAPTAKPVSLADASTATSNGAAPGLYGGSGDPAVCKVDQLVTFLQANPAKAEAWVGALNTDPNLRWPLGRLTVADIPTYVAQLTAVVLTADTRVTNHGFNDTSGNAYPLQSLLQKGTAVLVDKYGVPRVKCNCGNPLLPPQPLTPPTPPVDTTPPPSATPCLPPPIEVPDGQGPPNTCEPSDPEPPATDPPATPVTEDGCTVDPNAESFECLEDVAVEGDGWEGLGDEPLGSVQPSDTPQDSLQVTDPANPGALLTIPTGCAANGQCTLDPTLTNPNLTAAADPSSPSPSADPSPSASAPPVAAAPTPPSGAACSAYRGDDTRYDGTFTNRTGQTVYLWYIDDLQGCAPVYLDDAASGGGYINVYGTPGSSFVATDLAGAILGTYTVETSAPAFTLG